jgi:tetrapyrrole methylase family protein/MazG family protein
VAPVGGDLGPDNLDAETTRRFVDPAGPAFGRLVDVMARLRAPGGCPWDREQTHETLARHLVEETYEVLEAIDDGDLAALREELGDLVIQIVFHSNIAFEEGAFTIADVLDDLRAKLIRRHPHVFGDVQVSGAEEVKANWERIKRDEKTTKLYEGIPKALPALARAAKMLRRAGDIGFPPGWDKEETIFAGLDEEIDEVRAELSAAQRDQERIEAELGDLLLVAVALANRVGVEAESALRRTIERSERRMASVERRAAADERSIESLSDEEWQRYWDEAKQETP